MENYSKMTFEQKVSDLQKVLPIKFRVGSCNKAKTRYLVLPYIDARDCMDRLDQVFWYSRQRIHKDIWWKSYCSVWIYNGKDWIYKEDVGEKTKVAQEKWEASDAFKRACVNRWLWRFLYTMPSINITSQEVDENKYSITAFVKTKYKDVLTKRVKEYNANIDEKSKYEQSDDIENETNTSIDEVIDWFEKTK